MLQTLQLLSLRNLRIPKMPLYDYKCVQCEKLFSYRHSYKETMIECEVCKEQTLEKFLGNTSNFVKRTQKKKSHRVSVEQEIDRVRKELKKDKDELKNK